MDISQLYEVFLRCGSICTDTRTLKPGQLFVALKGEYFDGNTFVQKALESGAAYAVASIPFADERVITVPDTLEALQQLAAPSLPSLVLSLTLLTLAILGSASPLKPRDSI